MITFAEAMLITHMEASREWEIGTLYVRPVGVEDKTWYGVTFGAREWLVDRDTNFLIGDIPIGFVHKETGEYIEYDFLDMRAVTYAMTKVKLTPTELAQYEKDLAAK